MARSRNIKPGFFRNEQLANFPAMTRLLFAGLWTLADKAGRLEDRPRRIKADLFPFDDITTDDVDEMLDALSSGDEPFIVRYAAGGYGLIQVVNWERHQTPYHREKESVFPAIGNENTVSAGRQPGHVRADARNHCNQESGIRESGIRKSENQESEAAVEPTEFDRQRSRFTSFWNAAEGVRSVTVMSSGRVSMLRARLTEDVVADGEVMPWLDGLGWAVDHKFPLKTTRGSPNGWKPDVDWILKPESLPAILEGKYDWSKDDGRRNDIGAGQRYDPAAAKDGKVVGW